MAREEVIVPVSAVPRYRLRSESADVEDETGKWDTFWADQDVVVLKAEDHDRIVAQLQQENANLKAEWSVMARACGNYRSFGEQSLSPEAVARRQLITDEDYRVAAAAILKVQELHASGDRSPVHHLPRAWRNRASLSSIRLAAEVRREDADELEAALTAEGRLSKPLSEINLNDNVRVRLTEKGRKFLTDLGGYDVLLKSERDGWTKWQLWGLMEAFGGVIHLGCDVPFETTLQIEKAGAEARVEAPPELQVLKRAHHLLNKRSIDRLCDGHHETTAEGWLWWMEFRRVVLDEIEDALAAGRPPQPPPQETK